ncbi:MAG: MCE family protein, partial [Acidimicrobiia bacterium]
IAGTVPLFERVDPQSLATVIHELAVAAKGNGDAIASSLESGAQLASLLADTIDAQTRALDSWARFQKALEPTGGSLNAIAGNSNVALPELNAAERDFERALATLEPLAADLAELLDVYRPDIDAILVDGDNVIRVLVSRRQQLSETIHGLYRYAFKFGQGQSAESLPDGSKLAYFKVFILLEDLEAFVCASLAPTGADASYLEPVRQALAQSSLDCSAEFAAAAASRSGVASAVPGAPRGPDLAGRIHSGAAEPDRPVAVTLDALVQRVLQGSEG